MSSNLTVEPVSRKKEVLGTGLKFALRKIKGEPVSFQADKNLIPVLQGIVAVAEEETAKDAKFLIEYIEKHTYVMIREEY